MFEEDISLAELTVAHGTSSKTVYLQTALLDKGMSGMKFVLSDGEDVWKGQVSEDDLDKLSSRLKMEFGKFVTQSVSALTCDNAQDFTFEYHLKALPSDRLQLVWKKCVPADDIKFQLGHVNLERCESQAQSVCSVLSECVTATSSLKKRLRELEGDNQRLARDRANAVKSLNKCVTAKEELELDLFSKFVAILNSKKERIRDLEECKETQEVTRDRSPVAGVSSLGGQRNASSSRGAARNGQGSGSTSYAADTDEEADCHMTTPHSTVALEDSVNFGEDDDDQEMTTTRPARRPRKNPPTKKTSLPKPRQPRQPTPSIDRSGSTTRRSSLRKSGSGNSKNSENTDDLLAQI